QIPTLRKDVIPTKELQKGKSPVRELELHNPRGELKYDRTSSHKDTIRCSSYTRYNPHRIHINHKMYNSSRFLNSCSAFAVPPRVRLVLRVGPVPLDVPVALALAPPEPAAAPPAPCEATTLTPVAPSGRSQSPYSYFEIWMQVDVKWWV
ncbi:hypothetical protein EDB19DRAFT_1686802, partial [Suillus lakei]